VKHDPEKFMAGLDLAIVPVFRKNHAQIKRIGRDGESSHHALAPAMKKRDANS